MLIPEPPRNIRIRLIKLLTVRFKKPVSAPALARIREASVEVLERWTERVLEAESVDDLLR